MNGSRQRLPANRRPIERAFVDFMGSIRKEKARLRRAFLVTSSRLDVLAEQILICAGFQVCRDAR
jgi:hypothetical protein